MHASRAGRALFGSRSAGVGLFDCDWRLSTGFRLRGDSGGALDDQRRRFTFDATSDQDSEDKETGSHRHTLQPQRSTDSRKTLVAESPAGPHTPAQAHDLPAAF